MIRRPPRSTLSSSSAASDVYKRQEVTRYQEENGEIYMVLGNVAILKENSLQTIWRGIEYTVASKDLIPEEMAKIVQGFLLEDPDEQPK